MKKHFFSVYQLLLARECLRRWWLDYIMRSKPDYEEPRPFEEMQYLKGIVYAPRLIELREPREHRALYRLVEKVEAELKDAGVELKERDGLVIQTSYRGVQFVEVANATAGVVRGRPCLVYFKVSSEFEDAEFLACDPRVLFHVYHCGLTCDYVVIHQVRLPAIKPYHDESPQDYAARYVAKADTRLDVIPVSSLPSKQESEAVLDELLVPCITAMAADAPPCAIKTAACGNGACPFFSYCFGCNRGREKISQG